MQVTGKVAFFCWTDVQYTNNTQFKGTLDYVVLRIACGVHIRGWQVIYRALACFMTDGMECMLARVNDRPLIKMIDIGFKVMISRPCFEQTSDVHVHLHVHKCNCTKVFNEKFGEQPHCPESHFLTPLFDLQRILY